MLKTSGSTESKIRPGEGRVGVGGSKAGCKKSKLNGSELHAGEVDGSGVRDDEVVKGRNLSKSKKTELGFLTSGARKAFIELRQAFIKAPIIHHFDLERHIRVETDVSGYPIGGVLSQLTSDNSGQWHPVAFFLREMIPAETRYETHDGELLAIVKAFKTWKHYLEGSQHELLTTTTSVGSWRQKAWAPVKSAGPKNPLATTSELTIVMARLTELLITYLNTPNEVQKKNRSSAPRTSKFCTVCSLSWPMLAFQALVPQSQASVSQPRCCNCSKSSSVEPIFFQSSANSGTPSKAT